MPYYTGLIAGYATNKPRSLVFNVGHWVNPDGDESEEPAYLSHLLKQ